MSADPVVCSPQLVAAPMAVGPASRRATRAVAIRWGSREVRLGGDAPVMVQSMTNTDTADVIGTAIQVKELVRAGSEVVRITVNTPAAAAAVAPIREQLDRMGVDVPLVGDFHYNGHKLLADHPDCAQALSKYRINPGNVGSGRRRDDNFAAMIEAACRHGKPVRIGVNWGSLDQSVLARLMDENSARRVPWDAQSVMREALVTSAIESAQLAERLGLAGDAIVLSAKVSAVQDLIAVYIDLARRSDYAIHLGLTEAGMGSKGIVASSAALGILLQQGIGDTIRVSLTPDPGSSRTVEVRVAQQVLQSLDIRPFLPQVTACPGCGRTTSSFFQVLSQEVERFLHARMPEWRRVKPQAANLQVAVMGCVVNGPGESKAAHIGISLPGTGEAPTAPVFVDGKKVATLRGAGIAAEFKTMVANYVERRFGTGMGADR